MIQQCYLPLCMMWYRTYKYKTKYIPKSVVWTIKPSNSVDSTQQQVSDPVLQHISSSLINKYLLITTCQLPHQQYNKKNTQKRYVVDQCCCIYTSVHVVEVELNILIYKTKLFLCVDNETNELSRHLIGFSSYIYYISSLIKKDLLLFTTCQRPQQI